MPVLPQSILGAPNTTSQWSTLFGTVFLVGSVIGMLLVTFCSKKAEVTTLGMCVMEVFVKSKPIGLKKAVQQMKLLIPGGHDSRCKESNKHSN